MTPPFSDVITVLLLQLLISGIQTARILQITDVHLDVDYYTKGDPEQMCHQNPQIQHNLGQFGNYRCDSPKSLVKHLTEAASKILPHPDLLLLTGDYVPHITQYDFNYAKKTIQIVIGYLRTYFPSTTVLPVFGNHDSVPPNYFPDHDGTIYETVYTLWRKWIGKENENTFLKGGYYKYRWINQSVVVALNTNLYYRFNGAIQDFESKDDPAGQFAFLTSTLEEAKASGETVHIIAHIAPGVFERTPFFTWLEPQYNQRLIDITVKYASTIGWMIFGHHHTDTFHIVTDPETKQPVQVYLMSPSVTPWRNSLPGAGSQNPSFRIYDLDDSTQELTDATTYWVDLDKMNHDEAITTWTVEYSMKADYDIESLNATSMYSVLQRLKNGDQKIWWKYIEHNSVKWNVSLPEGVFRTAQLCAIENPDFAAYNACMPAGSWTTEAPTTTTAPKPAKTGSITVPVLSTLAVVTLFCLGLFLIVGYMRESGRFQALFERFRMHDNSGILFEALH